MSDHVRSYRNEPRYDERRWELAKAGAGEWITHERMRRANRAALREGLIKALEGDLCLATVRWVLHDVLLYLIEEDK